MCDETDDDNDLLSACMRQLLPDWKPPDVAPVVVPVPIPIPAWPLRASKPVDIPVTPTPPPSSSSKLVPQPASSIVNPVRVISTYKTSRCHNGRSCGNRQSCWFWHDESDRRDCYSTFVAEDVTNVCFGFVVHGTCSHTCKGRVCTYDHKTVPFAIDEHVRIMCRKTFKIY
jgi:hypothetical protein